MSSEQEKRLEGIRGDHEACDPCDPARFETCFMLALVDDLRAKLAKAERERDEATSEAAACLEFLATELDWEFFRSGMLYGKDEPEKKTKSMENALAIRAFLQDKGHTLKWREKLHASERARGALCEALENIRGVLDIKPEHPRDRSHIYAAWQLANDALRADGETDGVAQIPSDTAPASGSTSVDRERRFPKPEDAGVRPAPIVTFTRHDIDRALAAATQHSPLAAAADFTHRFEAALSGE